MAPYRSKLTANVRKQKRKLGGHLENGRRLQGHLVHQLQSEARSVAAGDVRRQYGKVREGDRRLIRPRVRRVRLTRPQPGGHDDPDSAAAVFSARGEGRHR